MIPAQSDYTNKDFDALRARLIALVQSVFPDWSDFSVAGFGNLLLEMHAFVGDVLTFYLDNQARESRLATATQRKNVIALARMLGYKLHGARAATAEIVFTLARSPIADVLIPAGTIIRTQEVTEPVRFQLLDDVAIAAGQQPPTAIGIVEHSQTHTQLFDARGLAYLDLVLDRTPFLDGSARVVTPAGDYTEVDSLLGSGPNDRHVVVPVDQHDRATLRFGNGVSGAPPSGTIRVTYKTGGGPTGNVDAGRLVVIEGAFTDVHGRPVQVSVTNPAPATGGTRRQTMASAKRHAPASLRALTRTVTREDFEINACRLPGVARALMLTGNEDSAIPENSGILYVIPEGGGLPTPALKNAALRQVTEVYPCTLTFQVSVQNPVYQQIDIEARVYVRQGHSKTVVRDRIKANLQAMFRISEPDGTPNPRVGFGFALQAPQEPFSGEIAWSDIFHTIRDTEGVRKIGDRHGDLKLNGLPADWRLSAQQFPILGTVTLFDGDQGGIL
ncbi:MAG: baseplate J/gp47 family protein [Proteobacteria bacterium]|nr:baseplate J/gp47 family protein [Pseudomonadota bacterium]